MSFPGELQLTMSYVAGVFPMFRTPWQLFDAWKTIVPVVGPDLASRLSIEAGLLFAVFAFASTVKRALLIAAMTLLWGVGLFSIERSALEFT